MIPITVLFALLSTVSAGTLPAGEPTSDPGIRLVPAGGPNPFTVDGRLRKNVDFWVKIYTQYTTRQGLFHDAKHIDLVYEVIDQDSPQAKAHHFLKKEKKRLRDLLLSLHHKQAKPETFTDEEKRIAELFKDIDEPNKFLNAAHRKRLRWQLGQKDQFLSGLKESGRYLPLMEEIFRREGLPTELTRLPFVESSFNTHARSKVGASGIWQFMRSTGKLFLKITPAIDERNDPLRATEAAAKLLRTNFESLHAWPLAVTAYNHGRQGMMRAVRKVGTDELDQLVDGYKSRSFGFASSNFFVELLAAIEVEKNAEKYFGKTDRASPDLTFEVMLPEAIRLSDLERFMKVDLDEVRDLNPALSPEIFRSSARLPAGYPLRLARKSDIKEDQAAQVFLAGYSQIPKLYRRPGPKFARQKR